MTIQFTCPQCGRQTAVADDLAGRTGPCAGCGMSVTVPGGATAAGGSKPAKPKKKRSPRAVWILTALGSAAVLFCAGLIGLLFLQAVSAARHATLQARCAGNLRQIALAMLDYHDQFGSFPPAYLAGKDGQPQHSWRVLLLPYLDEEELYARYDFDEPWDGPNNAKLAKEIPDAYVCPVAQGGTGAQTVYVMIAGPGRISDGTSVTAIGDVTDGPEETILVVETGPPGVPWMEPADLDARKMSYRVGNLSGPAIGSDHRAGGANALFCDSRVRFLRNGSDPKTVEALTTIDAGDDTSDFYMGY